MATKKQLAEAPPEARQRVIIYARVSTDDPRQAGSCDTQIKRCESYCQIYEHEVVARFEEHGVSAKSMDRPQWNKVVSMLTTGQADMVISTSLDRMSRNVEGFLRFCREVLEPHNKSFTTLQEKIDTTSASGRMLLTMLLAFAQFMREQTQEKVSGMRLSRAKDGFLTTFPPFGTIKGEVKGIPTKDPERWPWVEKIFELAASGKSDGEILTYLSERGVTTARSVPIGGTTVARVIGSRFYLGEVEYKGEWHAAKHECRIDKALWKKAQRNRKARSGPRPTLYAYLLEGLVVTSHYSITNPKPRAGQACPFYVRYSRNRHGTQYPQYIRADALRAHGGIGIQSRDALAANIPRYIRADLLDAKVVTWLFEEANRGDLMRAMQASVQHVISRESSVRSDRASLDKETVRLRRLQAGLKDKVVVAALGDQHEVLAALNERLLAVAKQIEDLELKAETLDAAIARMEIASADAKSVPNHLDMLRAAWQRQDMDVLKEMIGALVKQVDVRADGFHITLYALPNARVYELEGELAPTGIEPVPSP